MEAKLIVISGKANMGEVKLRLPMIIGRGRTSHLIISHPSVSREHCTLLDVDGLLVVRDNNSSNGVYVEGKQVKEAVVRPGQTLSIGPLTFRADYVPERDTSELEAEDRRRQVADTATLDGEEFEKIRNEVKLDKPKSAASTPAKPAKPAAPAATSKTAPAAKAPSAPAPAKPKAPAPASPASKAPTVPDIRDTDEVDFDEFLREELGPTKAKSSKPAEQTPAKPVEAKQPEPPQKPVESQSPAPPEVPAAKTEIEPDFDFLSDFGADETPTATAPAPDAPAVEPTMDSVEAVEEPSASSTPTLPLDFSAFDKPKGFEEPVVESEKDDAPATWPVESKGPTFENLEPTETAAKSEEIDFDALFADEAPAVPEPVAKDTAAEEPVFDEPAAIEPAAEVESSIEPEPAVEPEPQVESAGMFDFLSESSPAEAETPVMPEESVAFVEESTTAEAAAPESPLSIETAAVTESITPAAEPATEKVEDEFDFLADLDLGAAEPAAPEPPPIVDEPIVEEPSPAVAESPVVEWPEPSASVGELPTPAWKPPVDEAPAESPVVEQSPVVDSAAEPVVSAPAAEEDVWNFLESAPAETTPTESAAAEPTTDFFGPIIDSDVTPPAVAESPVAEWPDTETPITETPDVEPPAKEPASVEDELFAFLSGTNESKSKSPAEAADEPAFDFTEAFSEPKAKAPAEKQPEPTIDFSSLTAMETPADKPTSVEETSPFDFQRDQFAGFNPEASPAAASEEPPMFADFGEPGSPFSEAAATEGAVTDESPSFAADEFVSEPAAAEASATTEAPPVEESSTSAPEVDSEIPQFAPSAATPAVKKQAAVARPKGPSFFDKLKKLLGGSKSASDKAKPAAAPKSKKSPAAKTPTPQPPAESGGRFESFVPPAPKPRYDDSPIPMFDDAPASSDASPADIDVDAFQAPVEEPTSAWKPVDALIPLDDSVGTVDKIDEPAGAEPTFGFLSADLPVEPPAEPKPEAAADELMDFLAATPEEKPEASPPASVAPQAPAEFEATIAFEQGSSRDRDAGSPPPTPPTDDPFMLLDDAGFSEAEAPPMKSGIEPQADWSFEEPAAPNAAASEPIESVVGPETTPAAAESPAADVADDAFDFLSSPETPTAESPVESDTFAVAGSEPGMPQAEAEIAASPEFDVAAEAEPQLGDVAAAPPVVSARPAPRPMLPRRPQRVDVDVRLSPSLRTLGSAPLRAPRVETPQLEPEQPAGRQFAARKSAPVVRVSDLRRPAESADVTSPPPEPPMDAFAAAPMTDAPIGESPAPVDFFMDEEPAADAGVAEVQLPAESESSTPAADDPFDFAAKEASSDVADAAPLDAFKFDEPAATPPAAVEIDAFEFADPTADEPATPPTIDVETGAQSAAETEFADLEFSLEEAADPATTETPTDLEDFVFEESRHGDETETVVGDEPAFDVPPVGKTGDAASKDAPEPSTTAKSSNGPDKSTGDKELDDFLKDLGMS